MSTMTFDDGSTITDDGAGNTSSTQSPAGYLLTDYSSNFSPANASPGATNWTDVLKYGFGRVVDYKTASLQSANTPPQYAAPPVYSTRGMQLDSRSMLLIGGAILLFVLLSGDGKKKG